MIKVSLPANDWLPRHYQQKLWQYLSNGGTHAAVCAHRRWGKDEVCLHHTACALHERIGTYWHMLPEASQARKAIWEAINPRSGLRRIDEAFPLALRATTRENEMLIKFKNGSTWQVLGSDNYNSLVGSPPVGVVFSEFALANPSAWAYIRPILLENNGWVLFISTPRGKNHFWELLKSAKQSPDWFWEVSTVHDSNRFTPNQLEEEKQQYIRENGEGAGESLFNQEYLCSFESSIPGAYYATEMLACTREGRITKVDPIPGVSTFTSWDLGRADTTAVWFFQKVAHEIHLIDYYESNTQHISHYIAVVEAKPYTYEKHYLPHDARTKHLASNYSVIEQMASVFGLRSIAVIEQHKILDGIHAVRNILERCWFDEIKCEKGIEALRQYSRDWDEDKRCFRDQPNHDWASHCADSFRYLAMSIDLSRRKEKPKEKYNDFTIGPDNKATLNDMMKDLDKPIRTRI